MIKSRSSLDLITMNVIFIFHVGWLLELLTLFRYGERVGDDWAHYINTDKQVFSRKVEIVGPIFSDNDPYKVESNYRKTHCLYDNWEGGRKPRDLSFGIYCHGAEDREKEHLKKSGNRRRKWFD